jgi:hypothetical protein
MALHTEQCREAGGVLLRVAAAAVVEDHLGGFGALFGGKEGRRRSSVLPAEARTGRLSPISVIRVRMSGGCAVGKPGTAGGIHIRYVGAGCARKGDDDRPALPEARERRYGRIRHGGTGPPARCRSGRFFR